MWQPAITHQAALLAWSVDETPMNKTFEMHGFSADYLALANRLLQGKGYDKIALRCMDACRTRGDFYHLRRGLPIHKLPALVAGDDYRDVFFCEGQVHWMAAYWRTRQQRA